MIYITGDIHREQDIHKINPDEFIAGRSLTSDDYVLICGDFGCIWDGGAGDRFWLNWLESLPWNTCFIDGNHENFDVLETYPVEDWHGGKVHRIRSNIFHLMRGHVFDIGGKSFFTFGGGFSHDVMYRTENKNWWKREICNVKEVKLAIDSLNAHEWNVDYVLSHDIYKSHVLASKYPIDLSLYGDGFCDHQEVLDRIEKRLNYTCWFHGHYHTDLLDFSSSNKPCLTLFERVLSLEDISKLINK